MFLFYKDFLKLGSKFATFYKMIKLQKRWARASKITRAAIPTATVNCIR
jgi:hypothetical protein